MIIRSGTTADGEACRRIEVRAGELFRAVGMDAVADDEPLPVEVLARHAAAGELWVAEEDGRVVGYLVAVPGDQDAVHAEQLTIDPAVARRGIGRTLLDHLEAPLTLTTFRDVPWNAPYYGRLGFTVVEPADQGPVLRAAVHAEQALEAHGARVALRRP